MHRIFLITEFPEQPEKMDASTGKVPEGKINEYVSPQL
jgi:hypothetical protein